MMKAYKSDLDFEKMKVYARGIAGSIFGCYDIDNEMGTCRIRPIGHVPHDAISIMITTAGNDTVVAFFNSGEAFTDETYELDEIKKMYDKLIEDFVNDFKNCNKNNSISFYTQIDI